MLTAIGVDLKPNVSMVICIQGLVVGLILGLRALFKKLLYEAVESCFPLLSLSQAHG